MTHVAFFAQDAADAAPPILLTLSQRARTVAVRFGVARPRMVVGGAWLSLHASQVDGAASAHGPMPPAPGSAPGSWASGPFLIW
jgi:hypothetical protein